MLVPYDRRSTVALLSLASHPGGVRRFGAPPKPFFLCLDLRIAAEEAIQAQADDAEERFGEDTSAHLARALAAVGEDDGHLLEFEANLVGSVLHLDLEGVALESHFVEGNGLQHAPSVADESCRGVVDVDTRHQADVA